MQTAISKTGAERLARTRDGRTSAERVGQKQSAGNKKTEKEQAAFLQKIPVGVLCAILASVTLAVYGSVLRHDFVNYDDDVYVLQNEHVNTGLTWDNLRWAWTTDAASNWHPLSWMSHQLDSQIFGLDYPGGHHATSLLLHIVNAVLLFLLLWYATGARGCSLFVAGLFALHTFNVESVAWIAERKNVLSTLFFLLALAAYGWYARKPGVGRYLCTAGLFALGLASKPMVITLPFVLLLLDFWPLQRVEGWTTPSERIRVRRASLGRLVVEKIPLLALSAASAAITLIVQHHGNQIVSFENSPLSWRLQNATWAYATYLWKAFLPIHLVPFYPTMFFAAWEVALAAISLLAASWIAWKFRRQKPYLIVGYLWFLGTLVPVIGIIQIGGASMADRYTYIPLIGIFVAVVWGLADAARDLKIGENWLTGIALTVLACLSISTWIQVSHWKDSITLWSYALNASLDNFVAEEDLAVGLANQGRDDEALPHFLKAREIRPDDTVANFNIAINLEKHGKHAAAAHLFETVIQNNASTHYLFESHRRLGVIYGNMGDLKRARAHLAAAVQINPTDPTPLADLATLEAAATAAEIAPSVYAKPTASGYFQLGQFWEQGGKPEQARAAYEAALKLDSNFAEAQRALAALHPASE